jgi:prophage tail gpP-like protein
MTFTSSDRGGLSDVVTLRLDGREVGIVEHYEVQSSVLEQPSTFALALGHSDVAADVLKKYPPRTPFELLVAGKVQHVGRLDGVEVRGDEGTTIDFHGRDGLAALHDTYVGAETSLAHSSYLDLVEHALEACGFKDHTVLFTAATDRVARGGVKPALTRAKTATEVVVEEHAKKTLVQTAQSQLGETYLDFVRRYLDRAGLFLWALSSPNSFMLGQPNVTQPPVSRLVRSRAGSNARLEMYRNLGAPPRYATCMVVGRSGGKKYGRTRIRRGFEDAEMAAWGYTNTLVLRDVGVANEAQAEMHARRKLAEGRRHGWMLSYTVEGHTFVPLGGGDRRVWIPDTTVQVQDDLLGLNATYWIESVSWRRGDEGQGTTTTLALMRPGDLLFGDSTES